MEDDITIDYSNELENNGSNQEQLVPRRSGQIWQPPIRLTDEYVVTDNEDVDLAGMFVAHEPASYAEPIADVDNDK